MPPTPHILLIDDQPLVIDVLCEILERQGQRVSLATTGQDALHQLSAHSFDAIITEISLPGFRGIELITQIRRDNPRAPIIILTADDREAQELPRLDNVQILYKPTGILEILEVIGRALG